MLHILMLVSAASNQAVQKADVDAASGAWVTCVYQAAKHVAPWPEPVDALAVTAMNKCAVEENRFREAFAVYFGPRPPDSPEKLRNDVREQAIATIVMTRHGE